MPSGRARRTRAPPTRAAAGSGRVDPEARVRVRALWRLVSVARRAPRGRPRLGARSAEGPARSVGRASGRRGKGPRAPRGASLIALAEAGAALGRGAPVSSATNGSAPAVLAAGTPLPGGPPSSRTPHSSAGELRACGRSGDRGQAQARSGGSPVALQGRLVALGSSRSCPARQHRTRLSRLRVCSAAL